MDIKQAYRNIPVAPEDRHLLGIQWNDTVYIDQVLPFGLRSAPLVFSAVADALLWIMQQKGVSWAIHYIDNFLTIGPPDSSECLRNMLTMQETCARAGLPVEPTKSVGPATSLVFLGIEFDSTRGILRCYRKTSFEKSKRPSQNGEASRRAESGTSSHSSGSYLTPAKWSGPAEYFFAG